MRTATLLLAFSLLGCRTNSKLGDAEGLTGDTGVVDADGDGYTSDEDCDDGDATIHGGAVEVCDGIDNNCDGEVDEGVTSTFYPDDDGDGFGDPGSSVEACDRPSGMVSAPTDCDDSDATVYPSAPELCDGLDNNCDEVADEGLTGTWYPDADGDGFGDDALAEERCDAPSGWVQVGRDCDDTTADAFPGAAEVCDEIDNNCDGSVDEGVTTTYWVDADGDGYGQDAASTQACSLPLGYAAQAADCDDGDFDINPDALERCDGADNDCDGATDEDDAVDAATWYQDSDSDTFGDAGVTTEACSQPAGFVADATDCDDGESTTNPAASERCDGADNDCDGATDEDDAIDAGTWYVDADSDGYGNPAYSTVQCSQPAGYVADRTDCDDGTGTTFPGAAETCNDVDDDCDGTADDGLTEYDWYDDDDGDTYGDPNAVTTDCAQPAGTVTNDDDCNDSDSAINPAAVEICDSIDNDCDGDVDDDDSGVTGGSTFYADDDGDGYGEATSTTTACVAPSGYVSDDTDCDDVIATTFPGAPELCNDVDDDCDSEIDEYVLGYTLACPAESCADILDAWAAPDDTYLLDPDGSGADSYACDMTTDGGGWTQVVDWDRVSDGDSKADFLSHFSVRKNNMSTFNEESSRLFWQDAIGNSAGADVLAVEKEVIVPNDGETLYEIYYSGRSMEQSATYFFAEANGVEENLECWEGVQNWSNYSASERAERPSFYDNCAYGYAHGDTNRNISWSGEQQDDLGAEIGVFRFTSFHYDSCCDYSYLYRIEAWVR